MITLSDVKCVDCGHVASDHAWRAGCLHVDCECGRDPRQILLDELTKQAAELEAMRAVLAAAQDVWEWIQSWEPDFVDNPEWDETERGYLDALAKVNK